MWQLFVLYNFLVKGKPFPAFFWVFLGSAKWVNLMLVFPNTFLAHVSIYQSWKYSGFWRNSDISLRFFTSSDLSSIFLLFIIFFIFIGIHTKVLDTFTWLSKKLLHLLTQCVPVLLSYRNQSTNLLCNTSWLRATEFCTRATLALNGLSFLSCIFFANEISQCSWNPLLLTLTI